MVLDLKIVDLQSLLKRVEFSLEGFSLVLKELVLIDEFLVPLLEVPISFLVLLTKVWV